MKRSSWIVGVLMALLLMVPQERKVEGVTIPSVVYQTHVQSIGWTEPVMDGLVSGTTGSALRMEAIKIGVAGLEGLGVRYSSHVQGVGWQPYVASNALSGTEGQSKRMEAIKVELTGPMAHQYDLYYRAHVEKFGWLDWAKNGHAAGSAGFGRRVEAFEMKILPKGTGGAFKTDRAYVSNPEEGQVNYRSHVESYGWLRPVWDGASSGTEGEGKRVESLRISLSEGLPEGSIYYQSHVQGHGWMNEVKDGALSGTVGEAKRVEAIRIRLHGGISSTHGVRYRTHVEGVGWTSWSEDGAPSGTQGQGRRIEALEIKLYEKALMAEEEESITETFVYRSQVEEEIILLTNAIRREHGLRALHVDAKLQASARDHAKTMYETNVFAHTKIYPVGENIHMIATRDQAKQRAQYIVEAWMNSPGHRENILNTSYGTIGVGVVFGDQYFEKAKRTLPTLYSTQHFGR